MMITVHEAKERILAETARLPAVSLPLEKAFFSVLAKDIFSPIVLPLYDNSAMDGFAIRSEETQRASSDHPVSFRVVGVQRAGDPPTQKIKPGETIQIMTGATIPKGANAVVIQEKVVQNEGKIFVADPIPLGANIRKQGEEMQKGDLVLPQETFLTSRAIGLLANLGLARVSVYQAPKIALIVTGSELIDATQKRSHGKIYDSNTPMLLSALQERQLQVTSIQRIEDDEKKLKLSLSRALKQADVLLVVGGVSVGDYDFSKSVLKQLGVQTIFWGVAQKPGKPFYFGKKGKKLVFGIPGNPVSAWICFDQYVRLALEKMRGLPITHRQNTSTITRATLQKNIKPDAFKTLFLRGYLKENDNCWNVTPAINQDSHQLKSLAEANCLIEIPPAKELLEAGTEVRISLFEREF